MPVVPRALEDIDADWPIAYVHDLLVHPDHQRHGLGGDLLRLVLARFAHVRHVVLLTDDSPGQRAFYAALGLTDGADLGLRRIVRIGARS